MRRTGRSYHEQMQGLVAEYRDAGQPWPATRRDMARWMLRNNKWERGEASLVEICARDIARALREEFYTDPQGRRVRTKHAAKFPTPGTDDGQTTLWDDIRTAPRPFMERAFKGRRSQIVGDCVQLNTDVKSYNENASSADPIPMLWDFTDDVLESEQTGIVATHAAEDLAHSDLADEGDAPFKLNPPLAEDDSPIVPFIPSPLVDEKPPKTH